jgi:hypothetical protein
VRPGRLIALFLLLALALPSAAAASGFQEIYGDYKSDGELNGCYSPQDLHRAGGQIPPDIEQYAPGFGNSLSAAQTRCSSGGAAPAPEETEEPAPLLAGTAGPGAPDAVKKKVVRDPPAPKAIPMPVVGNLPDPSLDTATAVVRSDTPGALIALLIAAGIAVALTLAWTLAWFMGWSTERLTKPLAATFLTVWDRLIPGRQSSS